MKLLLILVSIFSLHAAAAPRLTLGMGFLAQIDHDVNPDNTMMQPFGSLFTEVAWKPWSLLWELNWMQSRSNMGNYGVEQTTYASNVWGRFEPLSYLKWSPYFGMGLGYSKAKIITNFGAAHLDRWADGGMAGGLALGVTTEVLAHWSLEGEARLTKKELEERMIWGFVVRSGYSF